MTTKGHLLFSIGCAIFAKNTELTSVLMQGDWWHIIPSAMLTCLLPDIDHPKSLIGQRLIWISKPIALVFGHRGFTHSLLAILSLIMFFYLKILKYWVIPVDIIQGMILGYISHIIADTLTPFGVPLFWPWCWRFSMPIFIPQKNNQLERIMYITLFVYAAWILKSFFKKNVTNWFLQIINFLCLQIDSLLN